MEQINQVISEKTKLNSLIFTTSLTSKNSSKRTETINIKGTFFILFIYLFLKKKKNKPFKTRGDEICDMHVI